MDFAVGFQINTHGYVSGESEERAVLVCTRQELDAYYSADQDGNKHLYQPSLIKYDGAYFESKVLLLITKQEGSGSIVLRVADVELVGSQLKVRIASRMPGFGTMDMARWVVGIELDRDTLQMKG